LGKHFLVLTILILHCIISGKAEAVEEGEDFDNDIDLISWYLYFCQLKTQLVEIGCRWLSSDLGVEAFREILMHDHEISAQ
jgi:hypothetical protein